MCTSQGFTKYLSTSGNCGIIKHSSNKIIKYPKILISNYALISCVIISAILKTFYILYENLVKKSIIKK